MKILVTGGAGFIGSNLADALVGLGHEVHIIDNLETGKLENINFKADFHQADIRNYEEIEPFFKGVNYVFHCAALPRVQPSILDPKTSHDINVTGSLNVLLAAKENKVTRVIYSASSSAYGNQKILPLEEELKPNPLSPYGLQKLMGEFMARLFSAIYGLETVSLRYFNVYGPRASPEGAYALVIGKFLEQKRKGEPLTLVPDGKQSRDFTHVRDVVKANMLAAESRKVGKGEVINIAGGKNYTILQVAELIGGQKVFIESRIEPKHTLADIRKAKELLGWEPTISLPEGIAQLKKLHGLK